MDTTTEPAVEQEKPPVALPRDLLDDILGYLGSCPAREVFTLLQRIDSVLREQA